MQQLLLSIHDLYVDVEQKTVVKGLSLEIKPGTVHAIMGPNGSGKSSLAYTLMGHPRYQVAAGTMVFDGQALEDLTPDQRAKRGIFLALQQPLEIEGVPLKHFLRQAYNALYDGTPKALKLREFDAMLAEKIKIFNIDPSFVSRPINVGFSGGEKKRAEVLQLAVLQPKLAILDEIDSGLDIDALRAVCQGLQAVRQASPDTAFLLITHYKRILNHFPADYIHVLRDGHIVRSGGPELADQLEAEGYK